MTNKGWLVNYEQGLVRNCKIFSLHFSVWLFLYWKLNEMQTATVSHFQAPFIRHIAAFTLKVTTTEILLWTPKERGF